ncbi:MULTISPECIES: succinate dehydrogenase, hydrophobic membrane anchor protein [Azorhizobium]|uniref:Succinate dehydrogenase hydrophobic membrane anchor subunit n=1 Tax=Azorhizobium caulinodans (strain ATCC 43989 / DSM 5975 / JCM 20966 / LMG 6465 / NBRC 14845 / NCIMB 13405 / ORS 571) TaxID=438753 RepID=A8INF2_AZOC5|nr:MULTISPECIES: succinate dehydrogenase, hydrophobic membrane anchor protein [Azorhizobium]TDU00951.1 succinate dehydrogenase subunit D [Azorhizobium sp. AG788]BAF89742.1 succinate dehydrogenase hydrophobic membrane anchor protein [Azorhizobium caulinodans ORS 571]
MHSPMRTPLGRVRGLGSARSGTEHFFLQRLTAIGNLILVVITLGIMISLLGAGYNAAHATLGNPIVAVVILLLLLSVTTHMRIGMQVVIEDYVHSEGLKVALIIANTFFTTVVGLAGAFAVLKISLGG